MRRMPWRLKGPHVMEAYVVLKPVPFTPSYLRLLVKSTLGGGGRTKRLVIAEVECSSCRFPSSVGVGMMAPGCRQYGLYCQSPKNSLQGTVRG